ncbi:hypothetical protein VPNG_04838 [Cytospora leucostoma]|uniref:Clr5 domain-containing protein n=1 Tax=Cytospora leucostoma TaxID=1230097 RepID=A0A423XB61_9PEZI|nr:hypothetical protein VPNG_04838 [Cytospora leucostoma]
MTGSNARRRCGKGRRKQTKRLPLREWDKHKKDIQKWYLEEDLTQEEVVEKLRGRNFRAKKRQLVHQLGKWGLKKNGKSSSRIEEEALRIQRSGLEHQTNMDGMGEETVRYARQVLLRPEDRGAAAVVHYAILDDSAAWTLCMDSYAATAQQDSSPGILSPIVLVLSGSAHTRRQAMETGQVLDGMLQTFSSMNDHQTALKARLLKAHMQVRAGDNLNDVLDEFDLDLEHLARHLEGVDVLTAHLLRALSNHTSGTSYVSFHNNTCYATLQSCICWSSEQLVAISNMPMRLAMLDVETDNEDTIKWREEVEIFFTLWHQWRMLRWDRLDWVEEAEAKLGITSTELLATVSCMLREEAQCETSDDCDDEDEEDEEIDVEYAEDGSSTTIENGYDAYRLQHTSDDAVNQERLLDLARDGANAIQGRSAEENWEAFIETFDRRNTALSGEAKRPAWMNGALSCIGKFIADTIALGTSVRLDQEFF